MSIHNGVSEMHQNLDRLRRLPAFDNIPLDILKLYAYIARRQVHPPGRLLFQQGDRAENAFFVLTGEVELFVERNDRIFILQTLGADGFFGYMALLADFNWPIFARTTRETVLLTLDREGFRNILTRYPKECLRIVERFVIMRIQRMQEHMETLMEHVEDDEQMRLILQSGGGE
jgi:CRP-like cAMP-binding protein